jgi:hypothetical protein
MEINRTTFEGMNMKEPWTFQDCADSTGYARRTLRKYSATGHFIEPVRVVGNVYLFEPREVMAWRRRHIANRAPVGNPPPDPKPARKRKRK